MQNAILILVIGTFLFTGYLFFKYFFSNNQNKVIQKARIEKIALQSIGEVWSPELYIVYYFSYNRNTYWGKDFIRIDTLLPTWELLLFDRHGYPVLRTEVGEFASEEHIEAFILSQVDTILIEFNTYALPESRIYRSRAGQNDKQKTLFQNLDIKFPWS